MIRSMTGFGRSICQEGSRKFIVEIRTVNHRYNDITIKLPRQLNMLEDKVREIAGRNIFRGKADIYISYENHDEDSKNIVIDEGLVTAYAKALEELKVRFALKDDLGISDIFSIPDVIRIEKAEENEEKVWPMLQNALVDAFNELLQMRQNEGTRLALNLLQKISLIRESLIDISIHAPEVISLYRQKLENRIHEISGVQFPDESRVLMETAIFADRCSIDEELARLESHLAQAEEILGVEQPAGRKLDFLVQEINREINTIGSKANDLTIIKNILEIKNEIEKIREQIQNIE